MPIKLRSMGCHETVGLLDMAGTDKEKTLQEIACRYTFSNKAGAMSRKRYRKPTTKFPNPKYEIELDYYMMKDTQFVNELPTIKISRYKKLKNITLDSMALNNDDDSGRYDRTHMINRAKHDIFRNTLIKIKLLERRIE